jgi:hypothetical protein
MGFIGRKFLKLFFLISFVTPFLGGCGLFFYIKESPHHKDMRRLGYDLCHINSCGPEALSHVFAGLGIRKSRAQIGQEIQDRDHVHYRSILGLASHKFYRITCPPELMSYCRSQGLTVKKVSFNNLKDSDAAIVLLKGRCDIEDWHWIEWAQGKEEIESFFGEDTKIISTYLLIKQ